MYFLWGGSIFHLIVLFFDFWSLCDFFPSPSKQSHSSVLGKILEPLLYMDNPYMIDIFISLPSPTVSGFCLVIGQSIFLGPLPGRYICVMFHERGSGGACVGHNYTRNELRNWPIHLSAELADLIHDGWHGYIARLPCHGGIQGYDIPLSQGI